LVTLPYLPPSLKELVICNCGELRSVSGQLGELEKLHIYNCNKLHSVNSLEDASSLETLFVSSCQCLASLGSSGGPGNFSALRGLRIEYCPAMDMKQFNKNVLDGLVQKEISHARSSDPHEGIYCSIFYFLKFLWLPFIVYIRCKSTLCKYWSGTTLLHLLLMSGRLVLCGWRSAAVWLLDCPYCLWCKSIYIYCWFGSYGYLFLFLDAVVSSNMYFPFAGPKLWEPRSWKYAIP